MSIRKPVIRKPKVPKIKKPLVSKRKRIVKKSPSLSLGRIKTTTKKPVTHKKTNSKASVGTCYRKTNCKGVLSRKVTKFQCRSEGGRSWKKTNGTCEKI